MDKITHTNVDCPRVALRLTCNECKYPASEARYNDESELPANFVTDRDLGDENAFVNRKGREDGIDRVDVPPTRGGTG